MQNFQKKYIAGWLTLGCLLAAFTAFAHGSGDTLTTTLSNAYPATHNTGSFADFPKMHPLVVHFPIVFLMLAFVIQIVSFFVFKPNKMQGGKELSWVILFLVILGFIGANFASNIFHGGDTDLSRLGPVTRATFETHEQYANYTVWISGFAAIAKIISHFFYKRKLVAEIITVVLMAGPVYTNAVTGDKGARLVVAM
ncbi:MAG TPA: DUF2231 domain-containing protein [Ginsengibacter sp.]